MHVLVADDDPLTRDFLQASLEALGYRVTVCADGWTAVAAMQREPRPVVALLDWMMPGPDGLEVCRSQPTDRGGNRTYCILVTSRGELRDVVAGLDAGADDYVTKPFDISELHARIRAGARVVRLQEQLADKVAELEGALAQVRRLQGLLPICSYCKRIRDDRNYWRQIEAYIAEHSEAQFTHGICPECFETVVRPQLERGQSPPEPAMTASSRAPKSTAGLSENNSTAEETSPAEGPSAASKR